MSNHLTAIPKPVLNLGLSKYYLKMQSSLKSMTVRLFPILFRALANLAVLKLG